MLGPKTFPPTSAFRPPTRPRIRSRALPISASTSRPASFKPMSSRSRRRRRLLTEVAFTLSGTKTVPVSTLTGLNTLLLSASSGPVPDIMALAATTTHDVVVNISNVSSTGALPSPQ